MDRKIAFSWSYHLAPRPSPTPLSRQSARPETQRKTEKERQLADGRRGEGVGEEPNHTTARKPGSLGIIEYSLRFLVDCDLANSCWRDRPVEVYNVEWSGPQSTLKIQYRGRDEIEGVYLPSQQGHSRNFVRDSNRLKGDGRAPLYPHQPGLIFPSWMGCTPEIGNRHSVCILWSRQGERRESAPCERTWCCVPSCGADGECLLPLLAQLLPRLRQLAHRELRHIQALKVTNGIY
jgi:hypothetical protein